MTFPKFIHPTTAQAMRVASLALAVADTALMYADKFAELPGVPAWLAYLWPYLLIAAVVVHQLASTFGITPDTKAAAAIAAAVAEGQRIIDQVNAARLAVAAGVALNLPAALQSTTHPRP